MIYGILPTAITQPNLKKHINNEQLSSERINILIRNRKSFRLTLTCVEVRTEGKTGIEKSRRHDNYM